MNPFSALFLFAFSRTAPLVPESAATSTEAIHGKTLSFEVWVGEVKSTAQETNVDLPKLLRGSLEREIKQMDLSTIHTSLIVSATVTRFEVGSEVQECSVSSAVRTRDGKLLAAMTGRASGSVSVKPDLILDQAVHGVVANLGRLIK